MSGFYSPVVVHPFVRIYDSELFSHVTQSTNQPLLTTFFEFANLIICPHSKKVSFGIYPPVFSIAQINSISNTPTERPDLPLVCVKFGRFQKPRFQLLSFVTKNPIHSIKNARIPPTACATSCYGAEYPRGYPSVLSDTLLQIALYAGSFFGTLRLI
jgi:hypothetical protein